LFQRYAVYFTPEGSLATCGAAWLGWDLAAGEAVAHPAVGELDVADLTRTPRKYGFHGTIKPPFSLARGTSAGSLAEEVEALCNRLAPVALEGLEVSAMGGFVALTPMGDSTRLGELAARVVKDLDRFRAPPDAAELERRRRSRLSPAQEMNLETWGYPYVMDQFRFHLTLTGRINGATEEVVMALRRHFTPHLSAPFTINTLTLVGQDGNGMFHQVHRFALSGYPAGH
jgi:putative phosphonate metabolism protein